MLFSKSNAGFRKLDTAALFRCYCTIYYKCTQYGSIIENNIVERGAPASLPTRLEHASRWSAALCSKTPCAKTKESSYEPMFRKK